VGVADYNRLKRERFVPLRRAFAVRDKPVKVKDANEMHGTKETHGTKEMHGTKERFILVLSHQPSVIERIGKYSPDLLLCGHTHGGQVRFPLLPALYAPNQGLLPRYDHGWYKAGDMDVYISKGIGATYFNVRLFNRAEVAVVEVCGGFAPLGKCVQM
jgi:predicted MPP superfamily phosphohydrolase